MSTEAQPRSRAFALLLGAALLAALIAVLARSKLNPAPVEPERPKLAAVEAPPPPPPPAPPAEPAAADAEAARQALLGLDREVKPKGVDVTRRPEPAPAARPRNAPEADHPPEIIEEEPELGLSDVRFRQTVERWRGVQNCIAARAKKSGEAPSGSLRIGFEILTSGEVSKTRVFDESSEEAKEIGPCVAQQARQLRFPPFRSEAGEDRVNKDAKFVF